MIINPIPNLYAYSTLPGFIRKGWEKHFKDKGIGGNKLIGCICDKMKKRLVPPHLRSTKHTVINVDAKPRTKTEITLGTHF